MFKHYYFVKSVILLFRAGFIHRGYHTSNLISRIRYAYIHTKRGIAIGECSMDAYRLEKHYEKLKESLKNRGLI